MLELKKTTNFGRSFKTIGSRIYSFGLGGRFLFASVMSATVRVGVSGGGPVCLPMLLTHNIPIVTAKHNLENVKAFGCGVFFLICFFLSLRA